MIKAIFLDVDGTLISFNTHQIPDSAITTLNKLHQRGIKIFIATGRASSDLTELESIPYHGVVALNGSDCVLRDKRVIARHAIPRHEFYKSLALSREYDFPIALELNEGIFVNRLQGIVASISAEVNHPVPPIVDVEELFDKSECCQLCFYCNQAVEKEVMAKLPNLEASRWHPSFTDINVAGVNKATGIEEVARYLNIDLSQTIAFGDGGNDISMLKRAGTGVAMGNASAKVKAAADYVADSVDNDGLSKALHALLGADAIDL